MKTRVDSIDILRGLAILLMVLSGIQPFGNLPAWMYHAQTPPPTHAHMPLIAGITWVDLVFPFFIFTMGLAIPLAMNRKMDSGITFLNAVSAAFKRFFLLIGFSIFVVHVNPFIITAPPSLKTWTISLFMFFWMFTIWGRFPFKLNPKINGLIKLTGVVVACLILVNIDYKGQSFSIFRKDIILFVLADLALFGTIVWLITRKNLLLRIGILAIIAAVYFSYMQQGSWLNIVGNKYSITFIENMIKANVSGENIHYFRWLYDMSWLLQWRFLKYLFVLIPGTIIGDLISNYISDPDTARASWSKSRYFSVFLAAFALVLTSVIGLYCRKLFASASISALLVIICLKLMSHPVSKLEKLLLKLFKWASFWLLLGYTLEPYQGGIKKDPSTFSFYFITTALAMFSLIAIEILTAIFKKEKIFSLLKYSGQNPMIAYLSRQNLILPVFGILGLQDNLAAIYKNYPWTGFLIAVILVFIAAIAVSWFSKKRIFLRT